MKDLGCAILILNPWRVSGFRKESRFWGYSGACLTCAKQERCKQQLASERNELHSVREMEHWEEQFDLERLHLTTARSNVHVGGSLLRGLSLLQHLLMELTLQFLLG